MALSPALPRAFLQPAFPGQATVVTLTFSSRARMQSLVRGERVMLSKVDAFADGVAVSTSCVERC